MSNHLADHDLPEGREKWIDDVEASQRNIVFPDTVRNNSRVDRLLWNGSRDASLVQRVGIAFFGLTFAGLGIFCFWGARARSQSWTDVMADVAIGLFVLILGVHLCLNAVMRRKRAASKSERAQCAPSYTDSCGCEQPKRALLRSRLNGSQDSFGIVGGLRAVDGKARVA